MRATLAASVRRRAVPGEAVVERAAAGLDDDRHRLGLGAARCGGAGSREPVVRARGTRVRAGGDFGHVCEPRTNSSGPASACVSCSEIQQVIISGGHEVVGVRGVLVEADRLRARAASRGRCPGGCGRRR